MKRVIIHAGFHKTGTTTIQSFFRINRRTLSQWVDFPEPERIRPALKFARSFSSTKNELKLVAFQNTFAECLVPFMDSDKTLLISAEELSGHLPGRPEIETYSAAVPLAEAMASTLRDIFEIKDYEFYYSLRAPDAWLVSAYWHHVSATIMTMSEADYIERYQTSKDLAGIVALLQSSVGVPVNSGEMEVLKDARFGLATSLIERLRLSEEMLDALKLPARRNPRRSQNALNKMLEINRSSLSIEEKTALKTALKEEHDRHA